MAVYRNVFVQIERPLRKRMQTKLLKLEIHGRIKVIFVVALLKTVRIVSRMLKHFKDLLSINLHFEPVFTSCMNT